MTRPGDGKRSRETRNPATSDDELHMRESIRPRMRRASGAVSIGRLETSPQYRGLHDPQLPTIGAQASTLCREVNFCSAKEHSRPLSGAE
jgi:hypothetical protein